MGDYANRVIARAYIKQDVGRETLYTNRILGRGYINEPFGFEVLYANRILGRGYINEPFGVEILYANRVLARAYGEWNQYSEVGAEERPSPPPPSVESKRRKFTKGFFDLDRDMNK